MRIGRCYICGYVAHHPGDRIVIQNSPNIVYRHIKCHIGSTNWLKSARAKVSEFKNLFLTEEKPNDKKTGYNRKQYGPDPAQIRNALSQHHRSTDLDPFGNSNKIHKKRKNNKGNRPKKKMK